MKEAIDGENYEEARELIESADNLMKDYFKEDDRLDDSWF